MGKYDKLIELADNLNLPKHILKKSEELIKALFGPSVVDASGMISDQVKLRRFKNQITILEKAQEFLNNKGFDPKQLNLKVLAPMIEQSSLEEDETLQDKWAKLIANTLSEDRQVRLEQNCINILGQISPEEAILLDELLALAKSLRVEKVKRYNQQYRIFQDNKVIEDIELTKVYIPNNRIEDSTKLQLSELEVILSGLESLAVVKWETPDVEVSASKNFLDEIDVDVDVYDPSGIYLTHLGIEFIKICDVKSV